MSGKMICFLKYARDLVHRCGLAFFMIYSRAMKLSTPHGVRQRPLDSVKEVQFKIAANCAYHNHTHTPVSHRDITTIDIQNGVFWIFGYKVCTFYLLSLYGEQYNTCIW